MSSTLLDRPPSERLQDEAIAPAPDPAAIASATTSLGSYCFRWEASLIERRVRTSSGEGQPAR
jgi:hypothetical protein